RLAQRWRVQLRTGVGEAEYLALLARARIVWNRSAHGAANRRTFEAIAAGALLVQETGTGEVEALLRRGTEYVAYAEDDLEDVLNHFPENDTERRAIARRARSPLRWTESGRGSCRGWGAGRRRRTSPADVALARRQPGSTCRRSARRTFPAGHRSLPSRLGTRRLAEQARSRHSPAASI